MKHKQTHDGFSIWPPYLILAIPASFLLWIIVTAILAGGDVIGEKYTDLGIVKAVSSCRSGKRNVTCRVETNLWRFPHVDITSYPGDMVQNGDKIGSKVVMYKHSRRTMKCKNGYCRPASTCASTMPCWY